MGNICCCMPGLHNNERGHAPLVPLFSLELTVEFSYDTWPLWLLLLRDPRGTLTEPWKIYHLSQRVSKVPTTDSGSKCFKSADYPRPEGSGSFLTPSRLAKPLENVAEITQSIERPRSSGQSSRSFSWKRNGTSRQNCP